MKKTRTHFCVENAGAHGQRPSRLSRWYVFKEASALEASVLATVPRPLSKCICFSPVLFVCSRTGITPPPLPCRDSPAEQRAQDGGRRGPSICRAARGGHGLRSFFFFAENKKLGGRRRTTGYQQKHRRHGRGRTARWSAVFVLLFMPGEIRILSDLNERRTDCSLLFSTSSLFPSEDSSLFSLSSLLLLEKEIFSSRFFPLTWRFSSTGHEEASSFLLLLFLSFFPFLFFLTEKKSVFSSTQTRRFFFSSFVSGCVWRGASVRRSAGE